VNEAHAMMESSDTGWVGHYKVSHIYPSPNRSEYFTVQSMNNFPHIVRIIPENNTKDQRTSGEFEVCRSFKSCNITNVICMLKTNTLSVVHATGNARDQ